MFLKLTLSTLLVANAFAVKLTDYTPFEYKVSFTNPICKKYYYEDEVESFNGDKIRHKPENVYCTYQDKTVSEAQENGPTANLLEWIEDEDTTEIFMAYLSFSSSTIYKALCKAVEERGLKVTLVYDSKNDTPEVKTVNGKKVTTYPRRAKIDQLAECQFKGHKRKSVKIKSSGGKGDGKNQTGYAHNKFFFVNPFSKSEVKIAFSSGNMSSGVVTHHENWHFITTNPKTYFAQAHQCLRKGVMYHDEGIEEFGDYIKSCRKRIKAEEEEDIKVFFIPGEGERARDFIKEGFSKARSVDVAAHRFFDHVIRSEMDKALGRDKEVRLVADDDLFYAGHYDQSVGRNMNVEARYVKALERKGLKTSYLETNNGTDGLDDESQKNARPQLHHNKFLIFNYGGGEGAVFTGAGNLTGAAFTKNHENFYFIEIKTDDVDVYGEFAKQYDNLFNDLGTRPRDLPNKLVMPKD